MPSLSKLSYFLGLFFKYLTLPWLAIFASTLFASELKEGDYFATGFEVRQNGKILFDDTMVYRLSSSLQIQRVSGDHYKFIVSAEIQQTKESKVLKERRVDQFRALWRSDNEGELLNLSPKHKDDRCRFELQNGGLKLDCWIARNQVWETQYYQSKNSTQGAVTKDITGFAEIFDVFCISTRLQLSQFQAVGEYVEKTKQFNTLQKVDQKTLGLSNPDANLGYSLMVGKTPYFLLFGERSESFGGPFCSVITELGHSESVAFIKSHFTTFKFLDKQKLGSNQITVFTGFIPNMLDVALSVQTAYGMSSISLYVK